MRPKLPKDWRKDRVIAFRAPPAMWDRICKAAAQERQTPSEWIRERVEEGLA